MLERLYASVGRKERERDRMIAEEDREAKEKRKREVVLKILDFFGFELRPFSDIHAGVGWAIFPSSSSSSECYHLKSAVSMWIPEERHLRDCVILGSSRGNPVPWHCFLKRFSRAESFTVPASDRSRSKSIDNPFCGLEHLEQLEIFLDLMSEDSEKN